MADTNTKVTDVTEEEKIDIIHSIIKGWKMFKKTWWLLILLLVVSVGALVGYKRLLFVPQYTASASFTVNSSSASPYSSNYVTSISIAQLSATFPYILDSGVLKQVVCEDLGLDSLPGTITTSVITDTNLFQINVTSNNPQMASDILESVITNYPSVARYIIGDTTLTMLDNTGVPTSPSNGLGDMKREILKVAFIAVIIYLIILAILVAARKTVSTEEDLKQYTNLQCLSHIPETFVKRRTNKKKQLLLVNQKVTPAFREAVSILRVRTQRQLKQVDKKIVMVTSSSENEGKTTVTSNLALSYAMKGYKTLIIDGDLRNPSVAKQFGIEIQQGLSELLENKISFKDSVIHYENTSLDILAAGKRMNDDKVIALINGEALKQVLALCREQYDYIFIDTPPCMMLQDATTIAQLSDASVLVIREDYIARQHVLDAMELLADTETPIIGYVLNYENAAFGGYGYGKYGYGKYGYGKYGKYGQYGSYGEKEKS